MSLSLLYSLARRGRDTLQSETSLNFSFSVHGVKTTNLLVLSYYFFPQGESSRPRGRKVVLSAVSEQCYSPSRGKCPTDENRANKSHCAINHGGYPGRPCKGGCTVYSSPRRYEIEVGEEEDLNHSGNTIPSPV